MREAVRKETAIREIGLDSCKFCGSTNITKKGIKKTKHGDQQQFGCKDCGRRFTQNLGFEKKRATPEQITMAVDLVFSSLSTRKTAASLKMPGVEVSYVTIYNWADEYGNLMDKFVDRITPQVGEKWRTDEIYLKIRGNHCYLFAMLNSETRFWLAKMVAEHKGNDDVAPMFKDAKRLAGKIPETLISDGASNFGHAHKKQYVAKNFLYKESTHESHVHMAGT